MTEIIWKDEYCIGVEEIDRQHMDFVKLMNRFMIVFRSGSHIKLQDRILLEILKYLEYHCISEENLMIISKYPNISAQEQEHKAVVKNMVSKCGRLREGTTNGDDIVKYLFNWFMQHTQLEDRKFAEYLGERNKSQKPSDSADHSD